MPQCIPDKPCLDCRGDDYNQCDQDNFDLPADQTADEHVHAIAENEQGGESAYCVNKYLLHARMMKGCGAPGKWRSLAQLPAGQALLRPGALKALAQAYKKGERQGVPRLGGH